MLDTLRRPLPPLVLAGGIATGALLVAFYCLGYTALAGRPESFGSALAWAIANICPWLLAVEGGKRAASWPASLGILTLTLIGSVVLGYTLKVSTDPLAFELWRRVPALAATGALVTLLRSQLGRRKMNGSAIPLLPRQIDWIRAAGNYVELRASGQTIVHRGSMSAVERDLADHGFVRIHRSTLVRRERIARVRPHDVILADGTHLKIGKRYRATLSA